MVIFGMLSEKMSETPSPIVSASFATDEYIYEILYHVAFPTIPSTERSKISWNVLTALSVVEPNTPSIVGIKGIAG